jgi:hypothetical protein
MTPFLYLGLTLAPLTVYGPEYADPGEAVKSYIAS